MRCSCSAARQPEFRYVASRELQHSIVSLQHRIDPANFQGIREGINDDEKIYVIGKSTLEAIVSKAENAMMDLEGEEGDAVGAVANAQETSNVSSVLTTLRGAKNLAADVLRSNKRHEKEDRVPMEDAVEVLCDIKAYDVDDKKSSDIPLNQRFQGTMLGKRSYDQSAGYSKGGGSMPDKRHKSKIPIGQGPKAKSRCRSCNQPGHWWKDEVCIYNVIRALVDGKEIPQDVTDKLQPEIRELFRKATEGGSGKRVNISDIVEVIGSKDGPSNSKRGSDNGSDKQVANSYFR